MSVNLELLTDVLAKVGISSSQEEEILTTIKNATTPLEAKEELKSEEFYTFDKEQAGVKENEEDEEGISGDHHANESCIEHRFQVSIRLDQFWFCFCFCSVNLHLQPLISHTFEYIRFCFIKSYVNILLLLLDVWFHWKFHYT